MSEQEVGVEIPGEELPAESYSEEGGGEELSVEEKARMVGWNPDHPNGKSAEDFLAANQDHKGLLRAENEKLFGKINELEQSMKHVARFMESREQKAREAGYNRAIAEQKKIMEKAVEDADRETFNRADQTIQQLEKRRQEERVEPIIPDNTPNPVVEKISSHQQSNPELFDLETKKEVWAKELKAQGMNGKSLEESIKAADNAVVQMFGLKRNMPGPSSEGGGKGGKITKLSQIPGAQAAYEIVKKKVPGLTVEEYLADIGEA